MLFKYRMTHSNDYYFPNDYDNDYSKQSGRNFNILNNKRTLEVHY